MRDLYATTMQLVHVDTDSAFDVAVDRALAWSFQHIGRQPPDLRENSRGTSHDGRTGLAQVEWWSQLDRPHRVLDVRLRHPDSEDRGLTWLATTTISESEGRTRATVRLERGSNIAVLKPWSIELRAPSLVTALMRPPLLASAGTLELAPGPRTIESADAPSLVSDVLKDPERALPVLVLSHDLPVALAAMIARSIAGLGQVVRGSSDSADEAINDILKHEGFAIPPDGMRLFWPGYGVPNERLRHPYWTQTQVERSRLPKSASLVDQLMKLLAPISTGRVPVDPAVMLARRYALQRSREEARQRPRRVERAEAISVGVKRQLDADLARAKLELDETTKERDHAEERADAAEANELATIEEALEDKDRVTELGKRISVLEAENAGLRANVRALTTYDDADEAVGREAEGPPTQLSTWDEIATNLPLLDGPGFKLTERALACADGKSRYPDPGSMWLALLKLEQLGRAYNELGGELGRQFEKFAFEYAGLNVALHDSTYKDDSSFTFEGETHQRLPHVKIDDAKSPNAVGRIYFAIDGSGKRLIVDWFGTKPDRPTT